MGLIPISNPHSHSSIPTFTRSTATTCQMAPSLPTTLLSNSTEENIQSMKLRETKQQNLAGELRGNGMGTREDLISFPAAYAPDNETPKSLQRPPNRPPDLT